MHHDEVQVGLRSSWHLSRWGAVDLLSLLDSFDLASNCRIQVTSRPSARMTAALPHKKDFPLHPTCTSFAAMRFLGFSLKRYRAFYQLARVDLAPITILLGRNHSGKTTLCRAPWFISQLFTKNTASPFPYADPSGSAPSSLLRVAYGLSGFEAELRFLLDNVVWTVLVHATAQSDVSHQPVLARLQCKKGTEVCFDEEDLSWKNAQKLIEQHGLGNIHEAIDNLGGIRQDGLRSYPKLEFMPQTVGFRGEHGASILGAARDLEPLNNWAQAYLNAKFEIEQEGVWESFKVIVDDGNSRVLLTESGTGFMQVLPVAAALLLQPRLAPLYCIEHPELHLHPHAHRAIAELLITGRQRHPDTCFLVETHSDTLVLRLRRAIVEKRLLPTDVRLVFVDRTEADGSTVKPITLNDRGVPDWWPQGVFSEANEEFAAMRRLLNERDAE